MKSSSTGNCLRVAAVMPSADTFTVTCPVGVDDTWTVPSGVDKVLFDAQGGGGGASTRPDAGAPGAGGRVQGTIFAVPTTTFPTTTDEDATVDLRRLIPAWIISGVVHVLLLSLFLLVTVQTGQGSIDVGWGIIEGKIDDVPFEGA